MKSCNTSSNPSFLLFQNRVRIFLVLAETRSFTEAAQRIGISQSAVSRSLNDFESELGVNLIQRSVRPVKLSDAGQVLYQMLSDQKQDIDRILFNIRNNNSLKTPLRLGVVESV
uniref:LysR family transcriptional regulator n=1 Tax=Mesosutterella multiformis TaxID=2259133 RepID=UPI0040258B61